ncbi:MAG: serine/threonine-protein kinase [Coriobacteriia bacterium]|nr:serine/threonine-protein kinase [Coriobacteriia bacterium]
MEKELQEYLDSLAQPLEGDGLSSYTEYRIERLLGCSDLEETQLVYRSVGASQPKGLVGNRSELKEEGPFVRKFIDASASGAQVYELLYRAQEKGACLHHVPHVIECHHEGESLVVVTEYVEGASLESAICAYGPSARLARSAFLSLCDAVIELHECLDVPVIHRDLKPSNVMLSDGTAYLIDFGISRAYKEGAQRDTSHFGTRSYAPPEQFGFGQTDVRSDVYALGMVLYFCLTGREPCPSLAEEGRPAQISAELWDVILMATRFDPVSRFADVRALKTAAAWAFDKGREPSQDAGAYKKGAYREAAHKEETYKKEAYKDEGASDKSQDTMASSSPLRRLPRFVGVLWNLLLLFVVAFFAADTIGDVVHPSEGGILEVFVPRILMDLGLMLIPAALLSYGLADLRGCPPILPLSERSWKSRFGLMAKAVCVVAVVTVLVLAILLSVV